MRVENFMTRTVKCCKRTDRLNDVSHIMWQEDTGIVPVVDPEHRLVGVITDRDVCMAAYTTGKLLRDLTADHAMSRKVHVCRDSDSVETAHKIMREVQVRRLPVVNKEGKLVGLVGLADLARGAHDSAMEAHEFVTTFGAVSRSRRGIEAQTVKAAPSLRPAEAKPTGRRATKP